MSRKKRSASSDKPDFAVNEFSIPDEFYEEFRKAIQTRSREHVDRLPELVNEIRETLAKTSPLQLISSTALYNLSASVSSDSVSPLQIAGLEQFHVELLQFLALGLPNWQHGVATPEHVGQIFEGLHELGGAFLSSRIIAPKNEKISNEEASLLEKVRLHTQAVRNWAHFHEVISYSLELYAPLDAALAEHHGFSATDLVNVCHQALVTIEDQTTSRFTQTRRILRQKKPQQIFRRYFKEFPHLEGDPDDMMTVLGRAPTVQEARSMVLAHLDLSNGDLYEITPKDLALVTEIAEDTVARVLDYLSLSPGATSDHKLEHSFLGNPVVKKPVMKFDGRYFGPILQSVFSEIHRVMDDLCEEAKISERLESIRSKFLEDKTAKVIHAAFPDARIRANHKWSIAETEYETDLLVEIDFFTIIFECKSNRFTDPARRGAPERLKRHVKDLVLTPSIQSSRLQKLIEDAGAGNLEARKVCDESEISYSNLRRVIRISVSLEDLSVITSSEKELKAAKWIPLDHEIAPVILLSDLHYITDILPDYRVLHYLSKRMDVQSSAEVFGDELDFLGTYLETGLEFPDDEKHRIVITNMSAKVDQYYQLKEQGLKSRKPAIKTNSFIRSLLEGISQRRNRGWTVFAMTILEKIPILEQRNFVVQLKKLKRSVLRYPKSKDRPNILYVERPSRYPVGLAFYLFRDKNAASRHDDMEWIAGDIFDNGTDEHCVVFAKSVNRWEEPYRTAAILERPRD
ncbi:hypothetical protein [Sphingomicrobium sediminis]|uniref:NERD domain-containing protein n=1 Tax=Sphingomicrobium sediminis TaxID=2950949 RepID=A0A9X2EGW7_9SPHN|nr:hypothetical protein [Sphingomicrobium sediminis]MCM8556441.1 hypothetical protein [Sphingomicrobium sediminis]